MFSTRLFLIELMHTGQDMTPRSSWAGNVRPSCGQSQEQVGCGMLTPRPMELRYPQGLTASQGKSLTVNVFMTGNTGRNQTDQLWMFLGSSSQNAQLALTLAGPLRRASEEKWHHTSKEETHIERGTVITLWRRELLWCPISILLKVFY